MHVCIGALNMFKHPGIVAPPLGAQESGELAPPETKIVSVSKLAQSLAKNYVSSVGSDFGYSSCLPSFPHYYWRLPSQGVHSARAQHGLATLLIGVATDFCSCVLRSCWLSITREPPEKSFQDRILILTKTKWPPFGFWVQACSPVF
jgi:hypothetical protein